VEIFTDGTEPDDNKFWCYTSGEYKPCYMNGTTTADTPTDPCFVEDPDGTPTVCDDVVVDYFSDDFSGVSYDSCRHTQTTVSGTPVFSMTGSARRIACDAGDAGCDIDRVPLDESGECYCQVTISIASSTLGGSNPSAFPSAEFGTYYGAGFYWSSGVKYLAVSKGGVLQWSTATSATSTTVKIAKVIDEITEYVKIYIDGDLKFSEANSDNLTNWVPCNVDVRTGTGSAAFDFSDSIIETSP